MYVVPENARGYSDMLAQAAINFARLAAPAAMYSAQSSVC